VTLEHVIAVAKEKTGEKNVSTEKYCQKARPWIQSTNEDERRSFGVETTTRKRPKTFNRLRKKSKSEFRNPKQIRNSQDKIFKTISFHYPVKLFRDSNVGFFSVYMSASFRKYERLRRKNEFYRVYQQGKKISSSSFMLYLDRDHNRQYRRLGITTSKKVGNAVTRNRCKRLVRELFRRNKEAFPAGSDIIVVVTREMVGKRYADLAAELDSIRQLLQSAL
jgi:ribonuclease P protein component